MPDPTSKTEAELLSEQDARYYTIAVSFLGGTVAGFFGMLAGAAWERALDKAGSGLTWKVAGLSAAWTVLQIRPTGVVSRDRKTGGNAALVALHCWLLFLATVLAFCVRTLRTLGRRTEERA